MTNRKFELVLNKINNNQTVLQLNKYLVLINHLIEQVLFLYMGMLLVMLSAVLVIEIGYVFYDLNFKTVRLILLGVLAIFIVCAGISIYKQYVIDKVDKKFKQVLAAELKTEMQEKVKS